MRNTTLFFFFAKWIFQIILFLFFLIVASFSFSSSSSSSSVAENRGYKLSTSFRFRRSETCFRSIRFVPHLSFHRFPPLREATLAAESLPPASPPAEADAAAAVDNEEEVKEVVMPEEWKLELVESLAEPIEPA